ncbi:MAG TPA: type VI secretion system ImpA family N-terminal domain-containing protein [Sphingomicrobium sp.]|nr:type VI secretion system ImpA family N-terminal domain-containing protein [Sphingomicrobium sp.]
MSDLEELMQPVSADAVAGPDLAYDPKRQEIEAAFEAARLADRGEGEAPDWSAIIGLIKDQAKLTKDATLAVYLARAGARAQRLADVALGCAFLAGMFETWWDQIHPSLQEYGFQGRKGACESLASIGDFLGPLRRVVFVSHPRLGEFTAEQIEAFATQGDSAENVGMFRAAVAEIDKAEIEASLSAIEEIRGAITRVDTVLTAKAEGDTATNFAATYEALDSIRNSVVAATGVGAPAPAVADSGQGDSAQAPQAAGMKASIESRADVIRAIEAIVDYYSRHEPGSPIPLVLDRAKAWVNMDFLSILNDINPSGAEDAKRVLTRTATE